MRAHRHQSPFERAIDLIENYELVKLTPESIRLRKRFLSEADRLWFPKGEAAAKPLGDVARWVGDGSHPSTPLRVTLIIP
jgi:hypothetical protein